MPKQTTKKVATKKTVAKKAATRKVAPVVEHAHCCCEHKCGCKCHHSHAFKKLIAIIVIFALGFATAKMCNTHKMYKKMPRPEFDNGCLVVKCPTMAQMVPMMDANHDGCVSVDEFKASKKHMRHPRQHMRRSAPQQPAVAE